MRFTVIINVDVSFWVFHLCHVFTFVITARSELRKVRFFGAVSLWFFVCVWNISGNRWTDFHQIHTEDVFGPCSDEFEGQGPKARPPGTKTEFFGPFGGLRAIYVS